MVYGPSVTVWFEVTSVVAEAEASAPTTPQVWPSLLFAAFTWVSVPIPMFWLVVKVSGGRGRRAGHHAVIQRGNKRRIGAGSLEFAAGRQRDQVLGVECARSVQEDAGVAGA